MKRSAILSLGGATKAKTKIVWDILCIYRQALSFYIDECWERNGRFDAETLHRLQSFALPYNFKAQALKQASGIVRGVLKSASATGRSVSKPNVMACGMDLSTNVLNCHGACNSESFDIWARLSTLVSRKPISLPIKRTRVYNKWAATGRLLAGGTIFSRGNRLYLRVTFEVPTKSIKDGRKIGLDRGVNNLLVTSDGTFIGANRALDIYINIIERTILGSKGHIRAIKTRNQFVNKSLKGLPWEEIGTLVIENLRKIKHGTKGKLSRNTNRRFSHWPIGYISVRLKQLCEENRVFLATVPARFTSQTCPECSHREKGNRHGSQFRCCRCGYTAHADFVGARNILAVYLGSISVPHAKASIYEANYTIESAVL